MCEEPPFPREGGLPWGTWGGSFRPEGGSPSSPEGRFPSRLSGSPGEGSSPGCGAPLGKVPLPAVGFLSGVRKGVPRSRH